MRPATFGAACCPSSQFCYTGVMEHNVGPFNLSLGTGPTQILPGVIRILRGEASGGGQMEAGTVTRSNQILNAGVELIPAIRTGFSNTPNFVAGLNEWIDGLARKPLCFEVGNEPNGSIASPNNYLDKLAAASPIIRAAGIKVVLACGVVNTLYKTFTGLQAMNQALLDGARGVTWADVDGICLHPYQQTPEQVRTAVLNNRNNIFGHAQAANKSLWVTEIGWPKAVESERELWCGSPSCTTCNPDYNGTTITEVQQADNLSSDDGVMEKLLSIARQVNLRAICWFAHADYNTLPKCDHFAHCGLTSADGSDKRPSYTRLKNFGTKKQFHRLAY